MCAGYVCGSGATSPTEAVCGGDGDMFCPEGSSTASKVNEGHYTVGGDATLLMEAVITTTADTIAVAGNNETTAEQVEADPSLTSTRSAERLCEPGFWCEAGFRYPCEAGTYGSDFGATQGSCSGFCEAGFVCRNGSVSPEENPCGDSSVYCPWANSEPVKVSVGYYSVGGSGPTTRTGQELSPPGSYADQGILYTCPAGVFGASHGLSSPLCSGPCSMGFYCEPGSVSSRERACGGPSQMCPAGSGWPIMVDSGYYTTDYATVPDEEACPPGMFRNGSYPFDTGEKIRRLGMLGDLDLFRRMGRGGRLAEFSALKYHYQTKGEESAITTAIPLPSCQLCPEGTFKAVTGDSLALCLPCDELTAESIEARTSCVCRRMAGGDVSAIMLYFNTTTSACQNVTASFRPSAEVGLVESTFTRYSQAECEPGHFCVGGVRFPCPGGRFGASAREIRPQCQGECAGGWYCPEGSVSANQVPCGAANLYCPAGSIAPTFVEQGFYTTGNHDASYGLHTPGAASAFPSSDFGTTGVGGRDEGAGAKRPDDDRGAAFRSGVAVCPAGWYCTGDGAGSKCPPGVYGGEVGGRENAREGCSNDVHRRLVTGAGVWWGRQEGGVEQGLVGLSDPACSGVCAAGFVCPEGSTSPFQSRCGGLGLYCPRGSSSPSQVLVGYYGAHTGVAAGLQAARDPLNETHSAQVLCEPGFFCEKGRKEPCPAGTFQWKYGESSRASCLPCKPPNPRLLPDVAMNTKAGYYCPPGESASPSLAAALVACGNPTVFCPEGSVEPVPVRAGFYSVGGGSEGNTRVSQASTTQLAPLLLRCPTRCLARHCLIISNSRSKVLCEAGYYCQDAARKLCPAGTYGSSAGLRDEGCTGVCPPGAACAEGTVDPTPCEEGYYATGGAVACNACPGKRVAGLEGERCRTSRSCCT
ncbi:unnamed protein product [Ectocarpus sp. CCAP 1310/34]|nr:unnamed protein product [Ectocarpus sp. CCAP 1310/34]